MESLLVTPLPIGVYSEKVPKKDLLKMVGPKELNRRTQFNIYLGITAKHLDLKG